MHFLLATKTYDDQDVRLDIRQLAGLANEHGHRITLLTFERQPPPDCPPLKIIACRKIGFALLDHWRFQRAFDQERTNGDYDATLAFDPVKSADFYLPRHLTTPQNLFESWRLMPALDWEFCRNQLASYFIHVTKSQGLNLQTKGGVPQPRLRQIDPEVPAECLPASQTITPEQLRQELGLSHQHVMVLQVADDWKRQGVDRSLAALSALHPSLVATSYFFLVSRHASQRKLERLAQRQGFPASHVINLGRQMPLPKLLVATDLLLHPARDEENGTMMLAALTAGVPVICTDSCGYSSFFHNTCCPVIPMPFHLVTLTDALEFTMLHLNTFKNLMPKEFKKLDLGHRTQQLLHLLESSPRLTNESLAPEELQRIISAHAQNCTGKKALKNERKRAISRVTCQGIRYLVKEFKRRAWWHLGSHARRTARGTAMLNLYTPQICGSFHDPENGSDYLVFHDCGDGSFFTCEYAQRPDAPELYQTCGKILAELHNAGIYHRDTKPANFVVNSHCQEECPVRVCLVDCDNVIRFDASFDLEPRVHNLAQFIAGTGKLARSDLRLWRQMIFAFCDGYRNHAHLTSETLAKLWKNVWQTMVRRQHIEFNLPDVVVEELGRPYTNQFDKRIR